MAHGLNAHARSAISFYLASHTPQHVRIMPKINNQDRSTSRKNKSETNTNNHHSKLLEGAIPFTRLGLD